MKLCQKTQPAFPLCTLQRLGVLGAGSACWQKPMRFVRFPPLRGSFGLLLSVGHETGESPGGDGRTLPSAEAVMAEFHRSGGFRRWVPVLNEVKPWGNGVTNIYIYIYCIYSTVYMYICACVYIHIYIILYMCVPYMYTNKGIKQIVHDVQYDF